MIKSLLAESDEVTPSKKGDLKQNSLRDSERKRIEAFNSINAYKSKTETEAAAQQYDVNEDNCLHSS